MELTLKGLTLHGKNRIREHGDRWRIVREGTPQAYNGAPSFDIESVETGHRRWILKHGDRNFEATETQG